MFILRPLLITAITFFLVVSIDFFFGRNVLNLINKKSDGIVSWNYKDEKLGLVIEKNFQIENAQWGSKFYDFCSNDLGLKSACSENNSKKKYKYAFLGDSFTEGIGVPYEKTFVGLFDNGSNNVINFAISGGSPNIHTRRLNYFLNSENIEIEDLFFFFDLTDFEDDFGWDRDGVKYVDSYNVDFSKEKYKKFLKDYLPVTYHVLLNIWWKSLRQYFVSPTEHLGYHDRKYDWDYKSTDLIPDYKYKKNLIFKNLNEISKIVKSKNINFYIVVYPHPATILYLKDMELSNNQKLISSFCSIDDNCKMISLYDNFYSEIIKRGKDDVINKYYFKGDIHFNEKGHKFVYESFIKNNLDKKNK